MPYSYVYTDDDDTPLASCPDCGHDLTADGGIDLELVMDGKTMVVPSRLNENGELEDTDDEAVAHGFHSTTLCGGCGEQLINMEGVVES